MALTGQSTTVTVLLQSTKYVIVSASGPLIPKSLWEVWLKGLKWESFYQCGKAQHPVVDDRGDGQQQRLQAQRDKEAWGENWLAKRSGIVHNLYIGQPSAERASPKVDRAFPPPPLMKSGHVYGLTASEIEQTAPLPPTITSPTPPHSGIAPHPNFRYQVRCHRLRFIRYRKLTIFISTVLLKLLGCVNKYVRLSGYMKRHILITLWSSITLLS